MFLAALHTTITRVYIAADLLRSSPSFAFSNTTARPSDYLHTEPNFGQQATRSFALEFKASQENISLFMLKQPEVAKGFVGLLQKHRFVHCTTTSGVTWLELLYISLGHTPAALELTHPRSAGIRPTIATTLRAFQHHALHIVKFCLVPAHAALFKVNHQRCNRLNNYGFYNRLPHLHLLPILHSYVISVLYLALLSMNSALTRSQTAMLEASNLRLKAKKFSG